MENKQFDIYHTLSIAAPVTQIYEAISEPEHLTNWWPKTCSGSPSYGDIYNFYFSDEYNWYGKVVTCDPNRSFHIKMTQSDPDWDQTTFGFDLEEEDKKVTVKFSHTGWPDCNDHYKISSYCWEILLQGLKNYVEKGIIIPFEERE